MDIVIQKNDDECSMDLKNLFGTHTVEYDSFQFFYNRKIDKHFFTKDLEPLLSMPMSKSYSITAMEDFKVSLPTLPTKLYFVERWDPKKMKYSFNEKRLPKMKS